MVDSGVCNTQIRMNTGHGTNVESNIRFVCRVTMVKSVRKDDWIFDTTWYHRTNQFCASDSTTVFRRATSKCPWYFPSYVGPTLLCEPCYLGLIPKWLSTRHWPACTYWPKPYQPGRVHWWRLRKLPWYPTRQQHCCRPSRHPVTTWSGPGSGLWGWTSG